MSIFSNISRSFGKRTLRPAPRGFTLIELLVVMSIMVVITSFLLVRQSKFDSSTLLRSLTYSVALSVRQAQVYGSSVLGTTTASGACVGSYSLGNCFASAYGVHFDSNASSYVLFADLNNNGIYDTGEAIKVYSLGAGYVISDFCAKTTGGSPITRCLSGGTISALNVMFRRPNPDAIFSTGLAESYQSGSIQLQFSGDTASTRNICIYTTGQISVEPVAIACP